MIGPRILDVGNCSADRASLRRTLQQQWDVELVSVDDGAAAIRELIAGPFQLVMINRLLDCDGSEGLNVLRAIKSDPRLASIPAMLITNYAEHQKLAIAEGAIAGFGKRELGTTELRTKIRHIIEANGVKP